MIWIVHEKYFGIEDFNTISKTDKMDVIVIVQVYIDRTQPFTVGRKTSSSK